MDFLMVEKLESILSQYDTETVKAATNESTVSIATTSVACRVYGSPKFSKAVDTATSECIPKKCRSPTVWCSKLWFDWAKVRNTKL